MFLLCVPSVDPRSVRNKTPSEARKLVESAIYCDPFGFMRGLIQEFPLMIAEAWTPKRKVEIMRQAKKGGFKLLDHVIAGDYDLCLWHTRELDGYEHAYMVSINNGQHNPNSAEAQKTKTTGRAAGVIPIGTIKTNVKQWIGDYGTLIIGSYIPDRNDAYLKLFKRLFPTYEFGPFHNNDWRFGFYVKKPS